MKEWTVDGYTSIADVMQEIKEIYVDDVLKYALRAKNISRYRKAPNGIYVHGLLEPLINFEEREVIGIKGNDKKKVNSFKQAKQYDKLIAGNKLYNIRLLGNRALEEPTYSYAACYTVLSQVYEVLLSLCKHTSVLTNIPTKYLDPDYWYSHEAKMFKPDKIDIEDLIDKIYSFVGKDYFHYYSLRLNNYTFTIEKHNDFRVIEYYKRIFEEIEEERFEKEGY